MYRTRLILIAIVLLLQFAGCACRQRELSFRAQGQASHEVFKPDLTRFESATAASAAACVEYRAVW